MRRLYLQIYLTIVASLRSGRACGGSGLALQSGRSPVRSSVRCSRGSCSPSWSRRRTRRCEEQQQAIERLASRLGADLALFGADGEPLAAAGDRSRLPGATARGGGWLGPVAARASRWRFRMGAGWSRACRRGSVGTRCCSSPFLGAHRAGGRARRAGRSSRRLTGRLERLQRGVESLGAGDLARARQGRGPRRGRAAWPKASIRPRRGSRASSTPTRCCSPTPPTSCARRSPASGSVSSWSRRRPERKAELARDIAELDQLVDEILLVSRLDAAVELDVRGGHRPCRARGRGMRALRRLLASRGSRSWCAATRCCCGG